MIEITNDFHGTTVNLRPKAGALTINQISRAQRVLCGIEGCACGGVWRDSFKHGGALCRLEPIFARFSSKIVGANIRTV